MVKKHISDMNIHEVRELYKSRVGMQPFAGNYSGDRRFAKTNYLCRCGVAREEEKHLISGQCPMYADIWGKFHSFDDDKDLVQFFTEVLERRDQLDDE